MHNGKTNSNDFNELEFPRLAFKGIFETMLKLLPKLTMSTQQCA